MTQENRPIMHFENCTVHVHVSGLASPAQEEALVTILSQNKPKGERFCVPEQCARCIDAVAKVYEKQKANQKKEAKQ